MAEGMAGICATPARDGRLFRRCRPGRRPRGERCRDPRFERYLASLPGVVWEDGQTPFPAASLACLRG